MQEGTVKGADIGGKRPETAENDKKEIIIIATADIAVIEAATGILCRNIDLCSKNVLCGIASQSFLRINMI